MTTRRILIPLSVALLLVGQSAGAPSGEAIYKAKCASCHGAKGEGTKTYKQRLEGDRSLAQLAEVIGKTMPEDDPGSLSAAESRAVSAYIHDAFYSKIARERNRPARVELARLTVRQYRQSLADLVGSFRWTPKREESSGLRAEYFKGRRYRPQDKVLSRIDPRVAFDFGTESPVPGKIEPHEFLIRWNGTLLAEETGVHEFVIRTEHAARLWINDQKVPLIDAWVKSGNDTEYRASLFLVGGRGYPIRLEYSKAKQGVDDSKTNKKRPPAVRSSIHLLWKTPHQALMPISARHLAPGNAPEVYVCSTPFPPDDRSLGWERGTTISKEWDEATTEAACEAAEYVVSHAVELSGVKADAPDRLAKLETFARTFGERAFRQPLSDEQKAQISRHYHGGEAKTRTPESALKRAVILILKSPHFLYREVSGSSNAHVVAARLSFGLWDSVPDRELLEAAARGQLNTREQVARQAQRMLADPRGRSKLHDFLLTWLKADQPHDLAKDAKRFPGFDDTVIADLRASLEIFLDEVTWSKEADFRQLLLAEYVHLSPRLAKFYGVRTPEGEGFHKVTLDQGKRAGVLSHPYLMTSFAHNGESSPIHRGVFLARGLLGLALRPPPEAVAPLAPDLHPSLSTRERVSLQTRPATCMTCHGVINPLGFTLENFDAVGRYRDRDKSKPVDATGAYTTRVGKTVKVDGPRQLAAFLADSPEVHAAFVEQMFHHLIQQPVGAYGPNTLEELRGRFAASGFHMRNLAVEIVTTAALRR